MSDIVSLNGYPNLSSRSDYYNTWLAQNSQIMSIDMNKENSNYQMSQISNAYNTANSVLSAGTSNKPNSIGLMNDIGNNAISATQNYVNHEYYIAGQMAQVEKQQMLPDKRIYFL